MNVLENIQVGDWVCCDNAQPDLRCRQVVKRTAKKVWTNLKDQPFRLDGKRNRHDMYHVRPATAEDLAAWQAAKQAAIDRHKKAESDKQERARQERIRDVAEELLAMLVDAVGIADEVVNGNLQPNRAAYFAANARTLIAKAKGAE